MLIKGSKCQKIWNANKYRQMLIYNIYKWMNLSKMSTNTFIITYDQFWIHCRLVEDYFSCGWLRCWLVRWLWSCQVASWAGNWLSWAKFWFAWIHTHNTNSSWYSRQQKFGLNKNFSTTCVLLAELFYQDKSFE